MEQHYTRLCYLPGMSIRRLLRVSACVLAPVLAPCVAGAVSFADAIAQDEQPPPTPQAAERVNPAFGMPGNRTWSVGGAVLFGGNGSDGAYQGFVAFDTFLAKDFQIGVELGGWFFDQESDDALGASAIMNLRWHFLPWEASKEEWSLFAELGIGIMGTTEDVPPGTGEFNFTPRAGFGATFRLGEGEERLLVGVRWQHVSNARIFGADDNDGSDMVMLHAGMVFPF